MTLRHCLLVGQCNHPMRVPMRRKLLVAASALALFAVPALAQTTSPGAGTNTPAAAQTQKADPLKQEDVSQIKGATVYGSDDKKIGAGGVLGVGAHDVALPIDQFRGDAGKGGFKIAKTEDELKKMPEWKSAGSPGAASGSGSTTAPASGSRPPTAPSNTR